jgi:hypothetical protein
VNVNVCELFDQYGGEDVATEAFLEHHGVMGMQWGDR